MVASEAPKARRMGSLKALKPTVSTAAVISSRARELPRIRSAWSFFSAPSWMAASGAPPLPGKGCKGGHQRNDGKGHPHPGQCQVPHLGDVADVDAVHDVVQHVDELGGHRWYGQLQHQTADGCRPQHI